ncbi:MAG: RtcB family protein [Candidatus Moranbacteria bacterium]|nr:RtcB family protein [Candidatus Moranbacteria bacterium]
MPIKQTITSEKIPIKLWLDDIEQGALEQAKNLANLPFAFHHIAIMPDCHQGYGMPIGGVLAAENTVVPNAVGVDIGCGMCACETEKSANEIGVEELKKNLGLIRKQIPLGFKHHEKKQQEKWMPEIKSDLTIVKNEYKRAQKQIGTLGGGNHFINFMKDSKTGKVWIMLHSGSRNLGKRVADYYNQIAKKINKKQNSKVPKKWDLAYLRVDSKEGRRYIDEMNYCVDFALFNRKHMLVKIAQIFLQVTGSKVNLDKMINIAHNYAVKETHFNREVWVHRKGATRARKGEPGIIPGCQGSKSYIIKGRGNLESFKSCSHGAGRQMGRRQAQKNLDLKKEQSELEKKGILHSLRGKRDLDEAPGAYKEISKVMRDQNDLVDIEVELEPLAVVVAGG